MSPFDIVKTHLLELKVSENGHFSPNCPLKLKLRINSLVIMIPEGWLSFLAAIAALYVTMYVGRSVGRMVGRSDGRSVPNEFQEVQKAYISDSFHSINIK